MDQEAADLCELFLGVAAHPESKRDDVQAALVRLLAQFGAKEEKLLHNEQIDETWW